MYSTLLLFFTKNRVSIIYKSLHSVFISYILYNFLCYIKEHNFGLLLMLTVYLRQLRPCEVERGKGGTTTKYKPLHGMYHRQTEEVTDIEKSY